LFDRTLLWLALLADHGGALTRLNTCSSAEALRLFKNVNWRMHGSSLIYRTEQRTDAGSRPHRGRGDD